MYNLVIGQKAYSSWSMRGWLLLDAFGLTFKERLVRLNSPEFEAWRALERPARTVPFLSWDDAGATRRVWDTMAMAETLAERHPEAGIWPHAAGDRMVARVVAAEMHAGFAALRRHCPMNFHRGGRPPRDGLAEARTDATHAVDLWDWALAETGGPWLGGPEFSAADAFMAPLATRICDYGLTDERSEGYVDRVLGHPSVVKWIDAGLADPERLAVYDDLP
ncbi:MAG: glutathione S-transferase N-terminal domain-containing protein [Pseudomonadota bacterium]